MIGDSDVDILTARNAGVWSIGCTFGLSPHTLAAVPPDCLVDSPAEWPLALADDSIFSSSSGRPELRAADSRD